MKLIEEPLLFFCFLLSLLDGIVHSVSRAPGAEGVVQGCSREASRTSAPLRPSPSLFCTLPFRTRISPKKKRAEMAGHLYNNIYIYIFKWVRLCRKQRRPRWSKNLNFKSNQSKGKAGKRFFFRIGNEKLFQSEKFNKKKTEYCTV